ncbi:MAG: hypothetical protein GY803_16575 [Chloroflexi bacterium]|nr:hypothetical protein [Chloroflexota bacterium]
MAYAGGGAATAGAAAAIANAIKASGAIVRMAPEEFMMLLDRMETPLIVIKTGGIFTKNYQYLVGYKGLVFFAKSSEKLVLPMDAELIMAKNIWIPT